MAFNGNEMGEPQRLNGRISSLRYFVKAFGSELYDVQWDLYSTMSFSLIRGVGSSGTVPKSTLGSKRWIVDSGNCVRKMPKEGGTPDCGDTAAGKKRISIVTRIQRKFCECNFTEGCGPSNRHKRRFYTNTERETKCNTDEHGAYKPADLAAGL
jgi:hypothetical protein